MQQAILKQEQLPGNQQRHELQDVPVNCSFFTLVFEQLNKQDITLLNQSTSEVLAGGLRYLWTEQGELHPPHTHTPVSSFYAKLS